LAVPDSDEQEGAGGTGEEGGDGGEHGKAGRSWITKEYGRCARHR